MTTPDEHADQLRDAVRQYVAGGGEQHLDQLLELANRSYHDTDYRQGRADLALIVRGLADGAWEELSDENRDRQLLLENLIVNLRRVTS